ncbi:hypothetical protein GQ600_7817 [Phytophthora cactorum]|nr:hypothetical protein GQ600_7817 [Phytophthora cactorum]
MLPPSSSDCRMAGESIDLCIGGVTQAVALSNHVRRTMQACVDTHFREIEWKVTIWLIRSRNEANARARIH